MELEEIFIPDQQSNKYRVFDRLTNNRLPSYLNLFDWQMQI